MTKQPQIETILRDNRTLISVDILRGFAAFSVYFYHQHLGTLLAKFLEIPILSYLDIIGSSYAVPLFFLLSGFCIHLSYAQKDKKLIILDYYRKRLWRIYPPYLIALIFSTSIIIVTGVEKNVTFQDFITHFFLINVFWERYFNTINLVLWTIGIEAAFYLIYPLFLTLSRRFNITSALAFVGLLSFISVGYFTWFKPEVILPERYFFLNLWFGWCFGAWLCEFYLKDFKYIKTLNFNVLISSILVISFFYSWENDILIKNIIYILGWTPILVSFLANEDFFRRNSKLFRIPAGIGLSSYSLYLFHQPLIQIKNYLAMHSGTVLSGLIHFSSLLLIPASCYLIFFVFERPFIHIRKS